jgi:hypothetical protein
LLSSSCSSGCNVRHFYKYAYLQVKELEEKVARLENYGGESGNKEEEEKRITSTYLNVSAEGTIVNITFSVSLCPVELLWSSISLWKINFILHSWQIHIAFRSSGCIF